MFYTVLVTPSTREGKVTARSSDGHMITTFICLLDGARYWQARGAPSKRDYRHHLVLRPRTLGAALNYRPRRLSGRHG
jgi:hypothetical protein